MQISLKVYLHRLAVLAQELASVNF